MLKAMNEASMLIDWRLRHASPPNVVFILAFLFRRREEMTDDISYGISRFDMSEFIAAKFSSARSLDYGRIDFRALISLQEFTTHAPVPQFLPRRQHFA